MTITLYTSLAEPNRVTKPLSEVIQLTGTLKEGTTVLNPSVIFTGLTEAQIGQINYAFIAEFNRYYFVTQTTVERQGVTRFDFRVDVLMSYAANIREQTAIVARQENLWNLNLDDGIFKVYQNPIIKVKTFPNGFNSQNFILAVAGSNQ